MLFLVKRHLFEFFLKDPQWGISAFFKAFDGFFTIENRFVYCKTKSFFRQPFLKGCTDEAKRGNVKLLFGSAEGLFTQ